MGLILEAQGKGENSSWFAFGSRSISRICNYQLQRNPIPEKDSWKKPKNYCQVIAQAFGRWRKASTPPTEQNKQVNNTLLNFCVLTCQSHGVMLWVGDSFPGNFCHISAPVIIALNPILSMCMLFHHREVGCHSKCKILRHECNWFSEPLVTVMDKSSKFWMTFSWDSFKCLRPGWLANDASQLQNNWTWSKLENQMAMRWQKSICSHFGLEALPRGTWYINWQQMLHVSHF